MVVLAQRETGRRTERVQRKEATTEIAATIDPVATTKTTGPARNIHMKNETLIDHMTRETITPTTEDHHLQEKLGSLADLRENN